MSYENLDIGKPAYPFFPGRFGISLIGELSLQVQSLRKE
jgi:hypothetical protein